MFKRNLIMLIYSLLSVTQLNAQVYKIDLKDKTEKPLEKIPTMAGTVNGTTFSVNNRYFEKDGKPWFPIMGEMHYNRVAPQNWEQEIIKMKNAGISIVATYVFWNEHETAKGVWDWKNNRDLRQFIQLCARQKMMVWLRIGPWSHGEQLHGGFPDWIQQIKAHRSNDPDYLAASKQLFHQIAGQTKGLYFKDSGPIIGIQLENEYASGQAEHISELKKMALSANISPVYWSVTANTVFDDRKMEVIPLQGSYPYRGWEKAGGGATKDFLYGNDQWIMTDALGKVFYDVHKFPKGLCEQGCGSQMTYNNRFVVEPHVVEAHLQNQIGRGMNLVGYYMFHGGTQTPGLKEPGLPESYDFQSPLSEFGLLRPSYRSLKTLHSFVNDFGSDLAKMKIFEPENPVRDEMDTKNLRYIARANGNSGFLFLGNTQVRVNMPDKTVSMQVNLPTEQISFPSLTLKGQTTAILPFNLKAGTALIKYVTAQPFARLVNGKHISLFFQELPGVKPQLAIDAKTILVKKFKGWQTIALKNQLLLKSEGRKDLSFSDKEGNRVTLIFLSRTQTENAWRVKLKKQDALLITSADVLAEDHKITLQEINNKEFKWQVYPKSLNAFSQHTAIPEKETFLFDTYLLKTDPYIPEVAVNYPKEQNALITLPLSFPKNVSNVILKIDYLGGLAQLLQKGKLITDNLFNGTSWQVGLNDFLKNGELQVDIQDLDDQVTGLPADLLNEIKTKGTRFKEIKALPQYQEILSLNN
ncbi:Glycosyl hydrolases family 35 [Pedobacter steynii]|uniref:Glycosyl hydrolases family 35 n=1 Tax=Pedobacter steynii TaxID=430522 RepID=A0A1H0CN17_9SPHI|nr:beta-galactosidase [Pedobacter steynii]NQX41615.1 beta-galactosidase [Pedobacter steynii]SDN59307.1 Glycosyl hydrolases family 35 [Pedobacter steynii]